MRARQDWVDQVYKTETAMAAVTNETARSTNRADGARGHHVSGKSELLSSLLAEQEIPHNLLNAKPGTWNGNPRSSLRLVVLVR